MMSALFGYMNLLIIIKWLTNFAGNEHNAPSIINTMINIPLKSGTILGQPFIGDAATNQKVSLLLLGVSLICIPLMLLFKPFLIKSDHVHSSVDEQDEREEIDELKNELKNKLQSTQEENQLEKPIKK